MCREDGQTAHAVLMMGNDQYCLKWNYHWTNLVGVFNSLLQTETFVDVTISCEGRRLKAHRLVLSACSPYFTRLLVDNPDRHPVIILKGIKYDHLKAIIHFIYNGEVAVEQRELPALISIARELQIRGLADNRLQEAQLQLAAAQSLTRAAEAKAFRNGTSANGSSCEGESIDLTSGRGGHQPDREPYTLTIDAPARSLSGGGSDGHSRIPDKNVISLPLSLVTSCADQPTDLTSSSKNRRRSRSPTDPPDKKVAQSLPPLPPPPLPLPPSTSSSSSLSLLPISSLLPPAPPQQRSPSGCCEPSQPPPLSPGSPEGSFTPSRKKRRLSEGAEQDTTSCPASAGDACSEERRDDVSAPGEEKGSNLRIVESCKVKGVSEVSDEEEGERHSLSSPYLPRASSLQQDSEDEPLALTVGSNINGGHPSDPLQQLTPRLRSPSLSPAAAPPPPLSATDKSGVTSLTSGGRSTEVTLKDDSSDFVHHDPSASSSPLSPPSGHSVTPHPHSSPLLPTTPVPPAISRHQLAFLQRALSVGYPHVPYFPPGLDPPQPGHQPVVHPPVPPSINSQTKDLLQFLDLVKSLGSAELAMTPGGIASGFSLPGVVGSTPVGPISPMKDGEPEYTCHICARIMPSQQFLDEHIKIHEEEKPYKCDHCGQRYKYQSAFQRHQEQNHTAKLPGEKPYRCTVCGQCFKYHKSFLKHRSNHDVLDHIMKNESEEVKSSFHPSYIQSLLNSRLSQSHHLTSSQASLVPELKDRLTSQLFKEEMVDIDDTMGDHHPPSTPSASLPENGEIKEEEEEMDDGEDGPAGKFMHCLKCKSTFRDVVSFDAHCKLLSPDCSQEFMREISVPGDNSNLSNPQSGSSSPPASPHRSPGWPSSLNSRSPLAGAAASSPQLQGSLLSPSCATTAAVTSSIYSSLTAINFSPLSLGTGKGGSCSAPIIVSAAASVCPASICAPTLGGAGTSKADEGGPLPQPLSSALLEEERPFKCPYCSKGFKGRENLKLHIRTHTGEKPYNCGVCGKAFGGRSDMNRHLRIHTGEKPYPCKVCGKKFARADYLSKHITTHLGIPFAKPVHSLQQSLQNLETIQNYQNMQNLQKVNNVQSN